MHTFSATSQAAERVQQILLDSQETSVLPWLLLGIPRGTKGSYVYHVKQLENTGKFPVRLCWVLCVGCVGTLVLGVVCGLYRFVM